MAPTPLVIRYGDLPKAIAILKIFIPKPLVIRGSTSFPYKINQAMPWKYEGGATSNLTVGSMETRDIIRSIKYYIFKESNGPNRLKNKGKAIKEEKLV